MKKKVRIFSSIYAVDRSHAVTNEDDCAASLGTDFLLRVTAKRTSTQNFTPKLL
jgi:hypothetical protein